jgi:hypothetical protein
MLKELVPHGHELALAYSSQGLNLREVFGAAREIHLPEGHANGTRGADDDAVAIVTKGDGGFDDGREDGEEGFVGLFVNDGGGAWKI